MGTYFIRIDDATDVRRKVLETSKASLHVLRSYQKLTKIRSEKQTMMKALRRELKELTMLVNRLEELSPTLSQAEVRSMAPAKGAAPARKEKKGKAQRASAPKDEGPHVYIGVNRPKPLQKHKRGPKTEEKIAQVVQQERAKTVADKLSEIERKLSGL